MTKGPNFGEEFRREFNELLVWRRDVRRFRTTSLDPAVVERLIGQACLSPSVGNSQPWRFVLVEDEARREGVKALFEASNREALEDYEGEQAKLYASLKLAGLDRAPVQMAVFVETRPEEGAGLGRKTMPLTLHYSVAAAVQTLFLAARAEGIGVGMVSIIDPGAVEDLLKVPSTWDLVSYLCLGYPEEESSTPELERLGWQARIPSDRHILKR